MTVNKKEMKEQYFPALIGNGLSGGAECIMTATQTPTVEKDKKKKKIKYVCSSSLCESSQGYLKFFKYKKLKSTNFCGETRS